jgi:hypothetical protein
MEKGKRGFDPGELIVPAIMIAVMAVFLYQSIGIDRPEDNLRLVWIVVGVLSFSVIVILFSLFRGGGEQKGQTEKKAPFRDFPLLRRQAVLYALVAVFVFLMDKVGFIVSGTVMLPLMFLASGVKKFRLVLIISLCLPLVTYIVFRRFFNILLPEGFIENFLVNNVLYRKWF